MKHAFRFSAVNRNLNNGKKMQNKKKAGTNNTGIWIVVLFVFVLELLFYAWCRVQYVRVGYEMSKASGSHEKLVVLQNNLKIELELLKSPERIASIAKRQLNLAVPAPEQMIKMP